MTKIFEQPFGDNLLLKNNREKKRKSCSEIVQKQFFRLSIISRCRHVFGRGVKWAGPARLGPKRLNYINGIILARLNYNWAAYSRARPSPVWAMGQPDPFIFYF